MARNQDRDRANLGEQTDMSSEEVDRQDRSMSAGSRTDSSMGSEGIEDPAMEQSSRESMRGSSREERSGRASSRDMSRVGRGRQQGRESKDDARSFSGKGHQKEGSSSTEGTGYTDGSSTDHSESENPLT